MVNQEEGGSCATMKQWMVIRSVGNPKIWGICKGRELEQPHKVLGGETAKLIKCRNDLEGGQ